MTTTPLNQIINAMVHGTSALPVIITKKQLLLIVPYTPQHILRLEKKGKFPRRIRIGPRRVGWYLAEIEAWLAQCERR
jgi:prophage regulatory protein